MLMDKFLIFISAFTVTDIMQSHKDTSQIYPCKEGSSVTLEYDD